jgi:hypothetical protein
MMKYLYFTALLLLTGCAAYQEWASPKLTPADYERIHAESTSGEAARVSFTKFREPFPKTEKSLISFSSIKTGGEYIEIGLLEVEQRRHSSESFQDLCDLMRIRASEVGADAVIGLQMEERPTRTTGSSIGVVQRNGQIDSDTYSKIHYQKHVSGIAAKSKRP